jgi:hypothetical protein
LVRLLIRSAIDGDSSNYATLRKCQISPKSSINKQRTGSSGIYIPTSSFRLPPPLSSSINNYESISSNRARSLENINGNERKLDIHYNQVKFLDLHLLKNDFLFLLVSTKFISICSTFNNNK